MVPTVISHSHDIYHLHLLNEIGNILEIYIFLAFTILVIRFDVLLFCKLNIFQRSFSYVEYYFLNISIIYLYLRLII